VARPSPDGGRLPLFRELAVQVVGVRAHDANVEERPGRVLAADVHDAVATRPAPRAALAPEPLDQDLGRRADLLLLTAEDITLVGSTLDGKVYITARIDSAGMVGATKQGTLTGAYAHNPVTVGSTKVDITLTRSVAAAAQPASPGARVPRIGLLWSGSTPFDPWSIPEALRHGFRELGYVEGKDVVFEPRYAEARYDRLPGLAAELVRLKVDVIVTPGTPASIAAKKATSAIPIVFAGVADALGAGLVASVARPGGNVTGLATLNEELWPKRIGLLKEVAPNVSRLAVLWNPANPGNASCIEEIRAAAAQVRVQVVSVEVRDAKALERAIAGMPGDAADAQRRGPALPDLKPHGRRPWQAIRQRQPCNPDHRRGPQRDPQRRHGDGVCWQFADG
jgi:hypothetical protein